jgi:hypothetical protein
VLTSSDEFLAGVVILENVAGLKATATNASTPGRYVISETDQQWTTQAEGDQLAAFTVGQQWQPRLGLESADVYLTDPGRPSYVAAVDWRRGDRIRILHDARTPQGVPARIDVQAILSAIAHQITPDGWVLSIGTTRAVAFIAPTYWDQTVLTWDDPAAVWGY